MKKVLILASVASMIDQFNIPNILLLQELGAEVHVLTNFQNAGTIPKEKAANLKKRLAEMKVQAFDVGINRSPFNKMNIKAYKEIKKILVTEQYDLVHCQSPIGGVLARIAARTSRKKGTKIVYTAHGFHFFKGATIKNWLIYYPVEFILARYTDCLITMNKEDYNIAQKKFKCRKIKLVNGVGVDLTKFEKQTDEKKNMLRKRYGFEPEDFVIIYTAELSYRKNQDILIDMMAMENMKDKNIILLLVGKGEEENEYRNKIEKLGLQKKIRLLGYREDVKNLIMISDMAVSSSRQEGLPVNIMEDMATGVPLIVSNCRGNIDLVEDGVNGFIINDNKAENYTNRILQIYQNPQIKYKFSNENITKIQHYSLDEINQEMKLIYSGLL
ncbi:glycosyltransferase family 4 protein [Carnobacterium viridans]|uniref:Glycosyltransferase involved in cell wall bisynthesis n=1 Tax=Carnobacterium viridans TaxID=174587 RepID=A0A1H0YGJ0_9LACT|nr:glycosyltransferase family 4 protein [Carnobacterium viridans]SDQ14150.1 Glycosyltransferase involved in cell wall bisynthesis [Carnobacterium viridans]